MVLPDTQNKKDERNIYIDQAGIKDIRHPLVYIDKFGHKTSSVGIWTITVGLDANIRGTHMSRFVELLNLKTPEFSVNSFPQITHKVLQKLEAKNATISVDFPFFMEKRAPASGARSLLDYSVNITHQQTGRNSKKTIKAVIPVTSLCPCSKSIADYGAHNQRSHITIVAEVDYGVSFEDIIAAAEKNASCELYAVIKRNDEKFVTEKAYDNPAFVEDLVRDVAISLDNNNKIKRYIIESENFESIHNHSAYAVVKKE